jgi:hypothetical protein
MDGRRKTNETGCGFKTEFRIRLMPIGHQHAELPAHNNSGAN